MIYIHLGAGAGDLDERADLRCGFTELIKKNYRNGDKIFLVEANPANIEKLKESYNDIPEVNIFNIGISSSKESRLNFYYAEEDAPHYQITSIKSEHVQKHYPNSTIKKFSIRCLTINDFLKNFVKETEIDYLSIDLEGIDYEILMSLDLDKFNIKRISIEHYYLKKNEKRNLLKHLSNKGYSYSGFGYDHNNLDYLFVKKKILWNQILSKLLIYVRFKKLKYLNFLIIKD